ncbi:MAG TPA: right-handed parallel beta-helix repeat-containing protein [Pyrinomonadaceae bacterium]|jgi:F-box protein 11
MVNKNLTPIAFMSYVRSDDQHENGRLTEFRNRLSGEVRMQTGEDFPIFQDRNDIQWGQNWKERIDDSIDAVTFLIPIITPGFFKSPSCREELERFLAREKELKRNDLVLPVYYVGTPVLDDDSKRAEDTLAQEISKHQLADWRELRFEPFTSPQVGRILAQLAVQLRNSLERDPLPKETPARKSSSKKRAKSTKTKTARVLEPASEQTPSTAQVVESEESGGAVQRPAVKNEPLTLIVDPLHRGNFPTITEAIAQAKAGFKILVRPGLYQEGLVIDKPLEIIGDGDPGDVVIQATGKSAVLFKTTMGRIANLTLRQMGGEKQYCVDIAQGRLELEGCDITSQSSACVAIHGGADPRLRRNRIHDGKQSGVFIYENGQGTLEDNDIFGNAFSGIEIKKDSNPMLRRNRIHDSKQSGVFIYENGQGTLEDNDIFGNALSGVAIREGSNPILRRNRIYDGKESGVLVYENGQGTLEDNDIFGNALSGIAITTGGNPVLRRNRIHDGKESGVLVYGNGQGTLEDNDIFGNALNGIAITTGSNPVLRRNRIHDEKESGVFIYKKGQGTLEDNDIFGNADSGMYIQEDGNPTLRNNRINKNINYAIFIRNGGGGIFEDNDLRDNTMGAWKVSADSEPKVKRARNQE